MKKIIIVSLAFFGLVSCIFAQDTIMFKNGDSHIAKILKISESKITYKDFQNLEGPDYIYNLSKVDAIHFKNGFVQTYKVEDTSETNNDAPQYINDVKISSQQENNTPSINDNCGSSPKKEFRFMNSYSERKKYYSNVPYYADYGDLYNPAVAGLASWFIPGLGQMISGETGRGLAFLGGYGACLLVYTVGVAGVVSNVNDTNDAYYYNYYSGTPNYSSNNNSSFYSIMMLTGLLGAVSVDIWSIVDAVHVAKVNNLYRRDLNKYSQIKLELKPYVSTNNHNGITLGNRPNVGATLSLSL